MSVTPFSPDRPRVPAAAPSLGENLLDDEEFRQTMRRSTRALVTVLLIPIICLTGLLEMLRRSAHWVDHSDRVLVAANTAEKLFITMQSGFRGYRLLHEDQLLANYAAARDQIGIHLDELVRLLEENPSQQQRAVLFKTDAEQWIRIVEVGRGQLQAGRTEAEVKPLMNSARTVITAAVVRVHALIDEEGRLRVERSARLDLVFQVLLGFIGVTVFVGIPLITRWRNRLLGRLSDSYRASVAATERRAAQLQVTLSSIGDAVIATDAQGCVDFLNPVAEGMLGWTNREARGRPLAGVFHLFNESTGAPADNPVSRVLRENTTVGLANHTVLRSRDGREYPIEDSAAPIRDDQGRVLGVILVFHDVSEKRRTERQLADNERRLRLLNDLAEATRHLAEPAEIMAVSARLLGQHLHASRCAYAEVAADANHFTIVHDYTDGCASTTGDYELKSFGADVMALLHSGRPLVLNDMEAETAEASAFRALGIKAIVCHPLIKEGGLRAMMAVHQLQPRRWTTPELAVIAEVIERCWATIERARAEKASSDSARRFQLLSEVVALQVWTATVDGALDYANRECANYFGGDVERDVLGNAWAQFVHAEDLPGALKAWQASLASGQRYEVEFRLRRSDGLYRWFLVRAEAMRDAGGRIVKWFGTNTDIDDLKRARDVAERASRTKDDFLAALSHELRTPLTPVLLTATTLRENPQLPAEVREQLGMMERNIALEARLIDDLLDLTAISRGKLQLRVQPCDAHALIHLALEIVRTEARAKGITLEQNLGALRHGLSADPARFQQVIWNLLRNAVKFTPPGGRIAISTREFNATGGATWLRIEVSDTGIGIDPALLEKIFLPFEQGMLTGAHRFGGLGLGLAIAHAIVELHGGRIRAQSGGSGQGATFVVEFPNASLPPAANVATPLQKSAATAVRPLRLLLVEDHENTLQTLQKLLQRDGHAVVATRSVAAALAAATQEKFDFVVSDLGLPDGTGNELMEKLRRDHGLRGIALSGYGMEEDLGRSRQAGFVAHLVKPVVFAELQRALAAASSP